jgi:photosystem II stability/assembly factor-like uncharacterized protein
MIRSGTLCSRGEKEKEMVRPRLRLFVLAGASLAALMTQGAWMTSIQDAPPEHGTESTPAEEAQPLDFRAELEKSLQWRCIGPARGGRVQAVAGVVGDPLTYYMGATGGGVWKTTDAGNSWENISDKFFKTGSVGAIAVAESDPNVMYVGMGEADVRGNFSHGDGVYRSLDAGKTWTHVGLSDSRQIGAISIHPKNPDLVYVAALGHIFGPNEERGIFRSSDGGATWQKVLYINENAGAIDIALNPKNPRELYAAFWQVKRTPWSLESGGEGSGLWKSTDGGETWTKLGGGLPTGVVGKIGIAVSPINPERVWAIVEHEEGGVYRSDDAGGTWRRLSDDANLRQRAWYYTHIYADPADVETVYVLNVGFHKSIDGGRTFSQRIRVPHGDNHDLWIDPNDPLRMVNGNDGGANVSFDGGTSWTRQDNQPTAQFYRVTTDNQFPYRVYGAQQDNSTVSISSSGWGEDFYDVGGGESGYIAVDPRNSDIVYAGSYGGYLTRYDHSMRMSRNITVWPENPMGHGAADLDFRFQWTFPIVISPHDPATIYAGGNILFKSSDEGQSWQPISPDLTTNDRSKQGPSGGPITKDNTSVEYYCTIFTVAESPVVPGLIWTGSDDGLIHVTSDAGATWSNVTPAGVGEWPMISIIEPSRHDADTAYAAITRYKMDDFRPYIYKTADRGASWSLIVNGIPDGAFVRSVREDPARPGLLYAATEVGMYYSDDDGANWRSLQGNLPITPVTDITVKDDDLVISTQGRSFWILDDLSLLREWGPSLADAPRHLFAPGPGYRTPGASVEIKYWLAEKPPSLLLEILDAEGSVVRSFEAAKEREQSGDSSGTTQQDSEGEEDDWWGGGRAARNAPANRGLNSFTWNLRYPDAVEVRGAVMWAGSTRGPIAPPGDYSIRLTVNGEPLIQPFTLAPDPRLTTTAEEYADQFEFLASVRDALSETHAAVNTIRSVRAQVNETVERAKEAADESSADDGENGSSALSNIEDAANSLHERLTAIEDDLIQSKSKSSQDPLNYPIRLNNKIAALMSAVDIEYPLTDSVQDVFAQLRGELDVQLAALRHVVEQDVPSFNAAVAELNLPAVVVKEQPDGDE